MRMSLKICGLEGTWPHKEHNGAREGKLSLGHRPKALMAPPLQRQESPACGQYLKDPGEEQTRDHKGF